MIYLCVLFYYRNDFLNMVVSYDCAINIEDLIKLSDVMNEHSLGPNGGKLTNIYNPFLVLS